MSKGKEKLTVTTYETASEPTHAAVASKRKLSFSKHAKWWLGGGVVVVLAFGGFIAYSIFTNIEPDAASCSAKTYDVGSNSSCVKYAQQLLNGVDRHFAPITQNGASVTADSISENGKLDTTTQAKISAFQKYAGIQQTGGITKNTWYYLCSYVKQASNNYNSQVAPSQVKTAATAYKKVGCASAKEDTTEAVADDSSDPTDLSDAGFDTTGEDQSSDATPSTSTPDASDLSTKTAPKPTSTTTTSSTPSLIRVATWNIEGGDPVAFNSSVDARKQGMAKLFASADIISLQESHRADFRQYLQDTYACNTCTMASVIPTDLPVGKNAYTLNGSLPASVPIFWNRSLFDLRDYGVYNAYSKSYKDANGPVSYKWITWVKLQDKASGKSFYVFNTHTVATVESKGQPSQYSKRVSIYKDQINLLASKLNAVKKADNLPVFVTGDFNVNYRQDSTVAKHYKYFPYTVLEVNGGMTSNWAFAAQNNALPTNASGATIGTRNDATDRLIDYVYISRRDDVSFTATNVNSDNSFGSDHYPVFATISLK